MQLPIALVWDSDSSIREGIEGALKQAGYATVLHASSPRDLEAARGAPVSLLLAGADGPASIPYDAIAAARRAWPGAAWAVAAGNGEEGAERAAREGAIDLLPRPPRPERVRALAIRALGRTRAAEDGTLIGRSAAVERLRYEVGKIAERMTPVLIVGEPGSGRTHVARVLHAAWGEPEPLEVSESSRPRRAGGGTVFVRDVDRLPWEDQAALAAGRFVASTSLDPARASDEARLHPALIAAVGDAIVRVPPLREHPEDVALLARSFVEGLRRLNGLPPIALEPQTVEALERHPWPGNVKELRDAVETAVILAADGVVRLRDLPEPLRGAAGGPSPGVRADRRFRAAKRAVVDAFERAYLTDLLGRHRGNVTGAAEHSGMLRSALQRLLRKHDLRSVDFRRPSGTPQPHEP
jgi:DNA-binding NtrC family response regulator